jgi:hypothetical protein
MTPPRARGTSPTIGARPRAAHCAIASETEQRSLRMPKHYRACLVATALASSLRSVPKRIPPFRLEAHPLTRRPSPRPVSSGRRPRLGRAIASAASPTARPSPTIRAAGRAGHRSPSMDSSTPSATTSRSLKWASSNSSCASTTSRPRHASRPRERVPRSRPADPARQGMRSRGPAGWSAARRCVGPEADGIVVGRVERQPRERARLFRRCLPLPEQRRLAPPGRRTHDGQLAHALGDESRHALAPRDDPGWSRGTCSFVVTSNRLEARVRTSDLSQLQTADLNARRTRSPSLCLAKS